MMTATTTAVSPSRNELIRLSNGEIDIDRIPLDDEATYQELCKGNSIGVFQLESPGMRQMMLAVKPNRIEDIMALISLYRPGPLDSGLDKKYINRKHGREPVSFEHPALEGVLGDTYGVMLYQEDVLNVAKTLAGFDAGEADDLRKVMGKKLMDKVALYRDKFVQGCTNTHNVPPALSNKVYSDIEKFAGYAFNRAHAASYAMVSYITAYLKTHYPAEYMAASLSSIMGSSSDKERLPLYLGEIKRLGINVLPPSINESTGAFDVIDDTTVRFGLNAVSGIGPSIVNSIISYRERVTSPYGSLFEWMRESNPEVLNKATIEHLIRSGALDELVPDMPPKNLTHDETMELLGFERHEIGVYLTKHPLDSVAYMLDEQTTRSVLDLELSADGELVTIGGVLSTVVAKQTKRGELMYNLQLEDLTGVVEVLVFPREAKKREGEFEVGDIVLLDGRVAREGDGEEEAVKIKIFFTDMTKPDIPEGTMGRPVVLKFENRPDLATVKDLSKLMVNNPGDSPVYLEFWEGPHRISFRFNWSVDLEIEERLRELGEILDDQPF